MESEELRQLIIHGETNVDSKQEPIYYPEIPAGYHWQTEQNDNVSTDKTIVIKAVNND